MANFVYQPISCSDEAFFPYMSSMAHNITPPNYNVCSVISSRSKKVFNGKCVWTICYAPVNVAIQSKKDFRNAVAQIKLEKPHASKVVAWGRVGSSTCGLFITYGNPHCACIQDFSEDMTPFPILEQRLRGEGAFILLIHEVDEEEEDDDENEEALREAGDFFELTSIYFANNNVQTENGCLVFNAEFIDYEALMINYFNKNMRMGSLKELLVSQVNFDTMSKHMELIIPSIQYSLADKHSTSNIKIDALRLVRCILQSHNPQIFHPYIEILVPFVINAAFDPFFKISTEAMLVLQDLVKAIRPLDFKTNCEFTPFVLPLYECIQKLEAQGVDQEVKDRVIETMGQVIVNMGDVSMRNINLCMPSFLECLRNEGTRLSAVKALTMIAASPLCVDLKSLADIIKVLGSFLRKNQRVLKLNTLSLLDALVNNYYANVNSQMLQTAIVETPPLISEVDLHIAQLVFELLTSVAQKHPQAMIGVYQEILTEVMSLVGSPLLQGAALQCTMKFVQVLVQTKLPEYRQILDRFKEPFVNDPAHPLHKQVSTLKVKANSVKEDELKRSALRALVARIPKADKNQQLDEFLKFVEESAADLLIIFESVQENSPTNNVDNSSMDQRTAISSLIDDDDSNKQ